MKEALITRLIGLLGITAFIFFTFIERKAGIESVIIVGISLILMNQIMRDERR